MNYLCQSLVCACAMLCYAMLYAMLCRSTLHSPQVRGHYSYTYYIYQRAPSYDDMILILIASGYRLSLHVIVRICTCNLQALNKPSIPLFSTGSPMVLPLNQSFFLSFLSFFLSFAPNLVVPLRSSPSRPVDPSPLPRYSTYTLQSYLYKGNSQGQPCSNSSQERLSKIYKTR